MIFGSSLRGMVKKEISSDPNKKEAFRETALPCVNATHSVTRFFSVISLKRFLEICNGILLSAMKLMVRKEISSDGN